MKLFFQVISAAYVLAPTSVEGLKLQNDSLGQPLLDDENGQALDQVIFRSLDL